MHICILMYISIEEATALVKEVAGIPRIGNLKNYFWDSRLFLNGLDFFLRINPCLAKTWIFDARGQTPDHEKHFKNVKKLDFWRQRADPRSRKNISKTKIKTHDALEGALWDGANASVCLFGKALEIGSTSRIHLGSRAFSLVNFQRYRQYRLEIKLTSNYN